MGREVPVLRRWGYDPTEGEAKKEEDEVQVEKGGGSTQSTLKGDTEEEIEYPNLPMLTERKAENEEPPLWGLDLSSTTRTPPKNKAGPTSTSTSLPIHQPTAARSYLLRSFHQVFKGEFSHQHPPKKTTAKAATQQREESAALLLHALDLLFKSWAGALSREELDRRAWGWYVAVRPEVKQGEAGWGQKGEVKLGNILALKRKG